MAITPEDTSTSGRLGGRRVVLVAGLAVALLVALWLLVLRGGGDAPKEATTPAPPIEEPVEPAPVASQPPAAKPGGGAVETFEVFASRDPFEPLISSAGDGSGDTTDAIVSDPSATTDPSTSGDSSASSVTSDLDGSDSSVGGHRVSVVDVYQDKGGPVAQIEVDGTVYKVKEGERFADNFELVAASGQCATILFGDDQFTLCEGEEILK